MAKNTNKLAYAFLCLFTKEVKKRTNNEKYPQKRKKEKTGEAQIIHIGVLRDFSFAVAISL